MSKTVVIWCVMFQLITGSVLFLYITSGGLLFTHDSFYYYAAAQSLLAEGTLQNPDGTAFTNWPPLYPLMLYFLKGNLQTIKLFHGVVYLSTLIIPVMILSRTEIRKSFFILFVLIHTFSITLISYQVFLLSEGVFILVSMLLFGLWLQYAENKKTTVLIALIVLSEILCLQRMMGVYMVSIIVVCMLLKRWYVQGLVYGVLSVAGLLIWIWVKQLNTPAVPLLDNIAVSDRIGIIQEVLQEISNIFIPANAAPWLQMLCGTSVCLVSLYFFIRAVKAGNVVQMYAFTYSYGYILLVILAAGFVNETARFIVPAVPFVGLFFILGLEQYVAGMKRYAYRAVCVFAYVWIAYTMVRMYKNSILLHGHSVDAAHHIEIHKAD